MIKMNVLVGVGALAALLVGAPARAADIASLASSGTDPEKAARILASKTGRMARIGTGLSELYHEYQAHEQQSQALERDSAKSLKRQDFMPDPLIRMVDGMVVIDAVAAEDVELLVRDLRALGARVLSSYDRVVSAEISVLALDDLAQLDSLQIARPAMATTNVGLVTSEGDVAINADRARKKEKVDGRGVTVGTLSDSYDCLGGAAADIASKDLPRRPIILDDSFCPEGGDEGRAMMQIIRDVAPGARQAFHTAFNGQADFAQGIIELATRARADVIVDDVIYFAEPMFQDGIIAQAVEAVKRRGVAYFSAAGNAGRNSWETGEAGFVASGVPGAFGIGVRHDFDPGPAIDDLQSVVIGTGLTIFAFQWDQPFYSVSGAPGSASDMDIGLYFGGFFTGFGGFSNNLDGDPVEVFGVMNSGPPLLMEIGLDLFAGPAPHMMKYVIFAPRVDQIGDDPPSFVLEHQTYSGTNYGHSNAAGAAAVGAAFWENTPRYGEFPPVVENFSAAGGTPILFDRKGRRISPKIRAKPNFVAPDGGETTFFGGRDPSGMIDPNSNNFFGTSAAAPHAAAVAALMLDANRRLRPEQLFEILEKTAIDMDDPGFDFTTGFGLVNALDAVETADHFGGHRPHALW